MKLSIFAFLGLLIATVAVAPASAQVSFSSTPSAGVSSNANVTFNFDDKKPVFTGGGQIVTDTTEYYAQPMGSVGSYFALGPNNGGTSASLFFGTDYALSSVSWIWGSLDAYNRVQFFGDDGALIGDAITGDMITMPAIANGDQSSDVTNRLVTFNFAGASQQVRGVNLVSMGDAMELDSVTLTAAVPEPSTWAMMFVGFGFVSAVMRRRQRFLVTA